MTKEQKAKIQQIIDATYDKELGCYVAPGQNRNKALKKAQKHHSFKNCGYDFPMKETQSTNDENIFIPR